MKAELVPDNGDAPIPISRDLTLLGRHDDCDVVIGHPSLSKRHCLLVKTDGLLVIRDLATTNGTKVKGQRVRWAALLPEDRVSFGAYKVRIYLGSDEMPSPSELRRGRNAGPGSVTPSVVAQVVVGKVSLKKTAIGPPAEGHGDGPPGFPEPSQEGSGVEWNSTFAEPLGREAAAAKTALVGGGFEIIEDDVGAQQGESDIAAGGFELIDDDDDDIVELG